MKHRIKIVVAPVASLVLAAIALHAFTAGAVEKSRQPGGANAALADPDRPRAEFVPGELLVGFNPGARGRADEVRKAIGARRKDILWQFLIEAMTLTGFGGLVGLGIGWLLTLLVKLIMPSYVPIWAPVAGFGASVGIGMVFGLWPAWKAASLDPIESLRYE